MRLVTILLLVIVSTSRSDAQRYRRLSELRKTADSMVIAAVGADKFNVRVIPLPEKTIVRKVVSSAWVRKEQGDRDTVITHDYTGDFLYRVYPPDRRDIHSLLFVSLAVHADTIIFYPQELSGPVHKQVTLPQYYGQWPCVFSKTKDLEAHTIENGNRELSRLFGKEVFDKEFKVYQKLVYPMVEGFYDDAGNEYQIPYDHRVSYTIRSPYDSTVSALIMFYTYPNGSYDTAALTKEIAGLPDFLRTGTNGHVLTKEQAIARALKLGLPQGKQGPLYKTLFNRRGKTYIWQVLSIEDYRYHVDMIGHPCEYSSGELMTIDAISGAMIERHKDGITEGCLD